MDSVAEYDTALLILNDGSRQFVEVVPGNSVRLRKGKFSATALLGAQYGCVYELVVHGPGTPKGAPPIKLIESGELLPSLQLETGSGADNRNLLDSNGGAQSLGAEEIAKLKASGLDGTAILSALVEGSSTFAGKTAFSQEKWLKKKGVKHVQRFRVVRTNPLNIAETAMLKHADKIGGLRADALSMMLTHADVRHGCTALVFDGVSGLLTAGVAHRMGSAGTLVAAHARDEAGPLLGYLPKLNLGTPPEAGAGAGAAEGASDASLAASSSSPPSTSASSSATASAPASTPSLQVVGASYRQLSAFAAAGPYVIIRHPVEKPQPQQQNREEAAADAPPATSAVEHAAATDDAVQAPTSDASAAVELAPSPPATTAATAASAAGGKRRRANGDDEGTSGASEKPAAAVPKRTNPHIIRAARLSEGAKHALLYGAVTAAPADAPAAAVMSDGAVDGTSVGKPAEAPITPSPGGVDCVLVAVPAHDPLPLLLAAVRCARPGTPFVAFSQQVAPLASAAAYLRSRGIAINTSVFELWGRQYQVLPMRTHPEMTMHGASGFVLTGHFSDAGYCRTAGVLLPSLALPPVVGVGSGKPATAAQPAPAAVAAADV